MSKYKYIGNMVNVRADESQHVRYLLLYYFLQGVGLALFSTVAISLFISSRSVEKLPVAYIASAVIMLVAGKLYDYIEHKYSMYQRAYLLIIMAVSVLLFYASSTLVNDALFPLWLIFPFFIWYRVINNVCDMEFWGLSAQLFDTRQAKRLFGFISAGEVPAKFIGFLSANLLVPHIGAINLLPISFVAFFLCFFILRKLLRKHDLHAPNHDHDHGHDHGVSTKKETLLRFFQSDFIFALGLLYFAGAITFSLIDFSFLTEVEEKVKLAEESANKLKEVAETASSGAAHVAEFFSLIMAVGYVIIFFSKLFFSSRVISRIGVKASLLSLPVFVIAICATIAGVRSIDTNGELIMWLFIILMIGGELFKAVFYEPLFLALSQPLPLHQRLKSHVVVRGFVDPLGLGLTGIGLVIALAVNEHLSLYNVDYVLIGLTLAWIVLVVFTYRKYLLTLKNAIAKRFIENKQLDFHSKISQDIIQEKLASPFPEEVIYAYEILSKKDEPFFHASLPKLLRHNAVEVREYALRRLPLSSVFTDTGVLLQLAKNDGHFYIKELATTEFCSRYDDEMATEYPVFLEHENARLRYAAIKGMLQSGNLEAIMLAGQKVTELLQSNDEADHVTVARLIGDMRFKNYYKPLLKYFHSKNLTLKKTALVAAGKLAHPQLIEPLVELLGDKKVRKNVLQALASYREVMVAWFAGNEDLLRKYPSEIVKVCTHVGGKNAAILISQRLLPGAEAELLDECLKGLYVMNHKYVEIDKASLEEKMNEQAGLIYKLTCLHELIGAGEHSIAEAITSELRIARQRLLLLLSLQYDKGTFRQIIATINKGAKYKNANALEMMDNILDFAHKQKILPVFENTDVTATRAHLSKYYSLELTAANWMDWLFTHPGQPFLQWTYAVILYSRAGQLPEQIAAGYRQHEHKIFREIMQGALTPIPADGNYEDDLKSTSMSHHGHGNSQHESLLEIEKVLVLKSVPMFAETSESILSGISEIMREVRMQKGAVVFKEGELGDCLYIIYDGLVSIHNDVQELAALGKREIFGELALLDPEPRSASATIKTDTLLLRIDKDDFDELIENQPEIAHGILTILTKRIRNQNKMIKDMKSHQPA